MMAARPLARVYLTLHRLAICSLFHSNPCLVFIKSGARVARAL